MPDWSYHPLFKHWITALPGIAGREFIHRGMNIISALPGGKQMIEFLGHMKPSPAISKQLFNCTFASPVGLSGKIDPLLSGTKAFSYLGFGFIEVGPVTLKPSNSKEAARFNRKKGLIHYPKMPESIGLKETIIRIKKQQPTIPLLFRLRIHKDEGSEELKKLTNLLSPFAEAFIIELNNLDNCIDLLNLVAEESSRPVILAVSHHKILDHLPSIQSLISSQSLKGLLVELAQEASFESKQTDELTASVKILYENGLTGIPIIISGGVYEPEDAVVLQQLGADLIMLEDGYVSSGPGLPKRINEALLDSITPTYGKDEILGWKWYWLFGMIIFCGGLLALFFSMTRVILQYDETFLKMTRDELFAINPSIIKFMAHDRMTLAGTMISGSILYMQLAKNGVRFGLHWTRKAINIAAISGFLGILLFIGYGYFDWLHGLFWLILLPFFIVGFIKTNRVFDSPISKNRRNTSEWKRALWGQLCFVILGFSFVIGGIVISIIGTTSIFVPTDIDYICIPPEILSEINNRLIPVIAHDRAGFGSALFSVGLLVLMTALWGYNEGAKWIWNTLLFGGIPAFCAGILTHFFIGYTTFIHLLPAYFALVIYILGLILSKDFLQANEKRDTIYMPERIKKSY
ncbi:dihydroorotate dehydrogenase [Bacillus sp. S/N-304-OC-R1]|uniref:dihydroorotate dehydrogenase n=1 Tax=Bacillus sp. S/N-304-OC-R1 TaxID=2758034 RepID=UPI001C8ED9FF|nr:dihydroorotate dehydrogenase [Bacillus sp. S/N-304-OC-R1]MBY0123151.1 dihydroorotate dehydrogenase [Bacillus sp. S/N-304-OC-R1]